MTIPDIISTDFEDKNILIIGCPASGKTWLANKIKKANQVIIHTDNYISYGYETGMYAALDAAIYCETNCIVEGIYGYRMLRKGVEYNSYYPDVVIELKVTNERMERTYMNERDAKKLKYLKVFNDKHNKILAEYFDICPKNKKPEWITILNNY